MNERINPDRNQVFLCTCPATLPYSFAVHPWFVVNKKGDVSRWELLSQAQKIPTSWQHLHKDAFSPFQGIRALPIYGSLHWPSSVRDSATGPTAQSVIEVIESTPETYPHTDEYHLLGPNSNTYAQWVLDNTPEFDATLPFNAIGKRYLR